MKFTTETLKRAGRTFLQAALAYIVVNLAVLDFSAGKEVLKSAIVGLIISAVAAGIAAVMNLERPEELGGGVSTITFDVWVKKYAGKSLDVDGVAGVQCVDLAKHFCRNVIGIDKSYTDAWGNAVEWYTKFNSKSWLKKNFTRIAYTKGMAIQKGDIGVFKTSGKNGHIVVCTGAYGKDYFYAYDENYNGTHAPMTERKFAYTGSRTLLGVLRPINQNNINPKPKTMQPVKPASKYFPKYTGSSGSIVDALASLNINSSYSYRKKIAKANGITGYAGLPWQNTKLLNWLKKGILIKP